MKNPFRYGGPVTGKGFIDRIAELEQLDRDMVSAQKIFLIAPRRYGKTSLLFALRERLEKKGVSVAFVDLYRSATMAELLSLLAASVLSTAERKLERVLRLASDIIPRLRPHIQVGKNGTPSLSIEVSPRERDLAMDAEDIFDLPERISGKSGKPFVVIMDEFQELNRFGGQSWEKKLRAVIQHHQNTGYVFSGSREHVLKSMVEDRKRAFYGMGRAQFLGPLPRADFAQFIKYSFKSCQISVESRIVDEIIGTCDDYPYNVQYLCHVLWDSCRDKGMVELSDIDDALAIIIDGNMPLYAALWESLTGHQRSVLKAVVLEEGRNVYSKHVRDNHRLGTTSSVDTSLKSLCFRKSILRKGEDGAYAFYDIFFRRWIERMLIDSRPG
jgi:uncharacterized protein